MTYPKKIVLLGHFGVGKTSLVRQFVETIFSEDYLVTMGVHVKKKEIEIDGENIQLIIWDIEGNTSIEKARSSYLLGAHGFIYVFDIMRPETYEKIGEEMEYLSINHSKVPCCIVGNKSDLFSNEFTQEFFSDSVFSDAFFTSAKTGDQVNEVFQAITKKIIAL